MDFYFYNSYMLSHTGFQLVKISEDDVSAVLNSGATNGLFKSEVVTRFYHSGGVILLEKLDCGDYMFVIKKLTLVDPEKAEFDRGSKIYCNFAFTAKESETERFCALAAYILTAFGRFKELMLDIIDISDSEMSYSIDSDKLTVLCDEAVRHMSAGAESILGEADMPADFERDSFRGLVDDICRGDIASGFMLAVFDSGKEYFEDMNRLGTIRVKYMFNSDGSPCVEEENSSSSSRAAVQNNYGGGLKLALCAAGIVAGGALIYGIFKFLKNL